MLNLFELNEKSVEVFPIDHHKAARKHFNEGWWKGFAVAHASLIVGAIIGLIIVEIIIKEKA